MEISRTLLNKSGIYKIVNLNNNKVYIGSATNLYGRLHHHVWSLNNNRHNNKFLQKTWNKHGQQAFKYEVLATCPKEYLLKLEQWFLDTQHPDYNLCKIAGSQLGVKKSEESKLKQSIAIKGRKQSVEHVRKRFANRDYTCNKVSAYKRALVLKGRKRTKESVDKQVQSMLIKINQFTLDKIFLKTWPSFKSIKEHYNITNLSTKLKTKDYVISKGFRWEYYSKSKEGFTPPEPIVWKKKENINTEELFK